MEQAVCDYPSQFIKVCDFCLARAATHTAGKYYVCDKPQCREKAEKAMEDKQNDNRI